MTKTKEEIDKNVKNFLQSKTIWGVMILLSPVISNLVGFDVSTEIGESYEIIIEVIGSLLALYGRWKANGSIAVNKFYKK